MKHNTNTNTKTAQQSNTQPRAYESISREGMRIIALNIASQVHTCKEASACYAELADSYGKDVAKEILSIAKTHVKARVQAVTSDAKSVTERLRDGAKIAKSAWNDLLADESVQGRMWARAVYESAGCDLLAMIERYASYVTADGQVARKSTRKDPTTGERESGYVMLDPTDSVSAWLSALKTAVKNAKKSALGASRSEYQRTVTLTWVLD